MADGRNCKIHLLDSRKIEIFIQPKLLTCELVDIVSSHHNLKEKEYFGIALLDESGSFSWLQLDRKVLDHECITASKKFRVINLYFMVKFFVESIIHLKDPITVELFFLHVKALVSKGVIQVEQETAFELASYVLQASYGDFVDLDTTNDLLKKQAALPQKIYDEASSPAYWRCNDIHYSTERVAALHAALKDLSRGNAIVNYMTIVESLSTYGVHYYNVTDKAGIACVLGISLRGIAQFRIDDRRIPDRIFLWKDLGNLNYRDRKFTAEVLEARRVVHAMSNINLYEDAVEETSADDLSSAISDPTTQVSVSRRTFAAGQSSTHAWFTSTTALAKAIWTMAVNQHQYYIERKKAHTESAVMEQRSPADIASDLNNAELLPNKSDLSRTRSGSVCSSYSYRVVRDGSKLVRDGSLTSGFASDDSISQMSETEKKEMYHTAKSRREELQESLKLKLAKLKILCLQEAQITGELPVEIDLALQPGEARPQVRRRMGTSFELSSRKMESANLSQEDKDLAELELHFELQEKITRAAEKLWTDASKTIRKKRKDDYRKEYAKLKDIEKQLKSMRVALDRDLPSGDSREFQISHSSSFSSGLGDSSSLQSFHLRPPQSPVASLRSSESRSSVSMNEVPPVTLRPQNANMRPATAGYIPNAIYRNTYRQDQYPTLSPLCLSSTGEDSTHTETSLSPSICSPVLSPSVPRPPVVIHHKIVVEDPFPRETTPERLHYPVSPYVAKPSLRSSSCDRAKSHSYKKFPAISPDVSTSPTKLTPARARNPRSPSAHETQSSAPFNQMRSPPILPNRLPVTTQLPNSPSPVWNTAELTKPYELADYYKYSSKARRQQNINNTTENQAPEKIVTATAYPSSPAQTSAFRQVIRPTGADSPSDSSSSRSDRTVSPKIHTVSSQAFVQPRPLQCLPALPRPNREAQIAWIDEAIPKTPTIV